ncbi:hypothetical protein [Paraflavitalea sp. CAU 1676]|uniref:hypothetical protein n=1 Tax=Paraflavitalea sp. CAU 1676 TaxID=3032598 RepID=UPI0023D99414|nr:hypothetical protein [Paraflavitalea sp. CAU 1676]MDF2189302.1 hypothetical protein [Paraflavitalea sp. CAU 1676]
MKQLLTVPNFTYEQGDPFGGDQRCERPIRVEYYNGSICLDQGENGCISILPEHFEPLFKLIRKHKPEAEQRLNR